jgi:hypothetical protein
MKIEPFGLERWLLHPHRFGLGGAGITQLTLSQLTDGLDPDTLLTYGGVTNGSETIRARIADLYENVSEDDVLVTTGAAEANFLVMHSLLEAGDELIAFKPCYWQCIGIARSLGARVKLCDLIEEEAYRPDTEQLRDRITSQTKVISLVNPNNPTGAVISHEEMDTICEIADTVGAWVLADGALRGLETDGPQAASPVEVYERGIATGSVTKPGLKGLRIGWLAAEAELLERCWILKDYTTLSHSGIGELLAEIALQPQKRAMILERACDTIRHRRALLSDWMDDMYPLLEWVPAQAGHTGFIKYDLDAHSVDLCTRLLEEEGVLLSPGDYFGSPNHLRLRYSCDEEMLIAGLDRIEAFLRRQS